MNVSLPMKFNAELVIRTWTLAPNLTNELAKSADLYAAIDPVTPSKIILFFKHINIKKPIIKLHIPGNAKEDLQP